jgi:hypothetical protein
MPKKRVQAGQPTRQQMRRVRPKGVPAPQSAPSGGVQRRQRERYVQSGGMLQGYAPERVVRFGIYAAAAALGCLVIMALFLLLLPYGWPVRIVAAIVWVVPIVFASSIVLPGVRLALKDRKAQPRMVQGNLLGASEVSTALGLGMLMLRTRGGTEQYLVPPDKLARVPGNQVTVMLTVTPFLRHVRSVSVMGQRIVGRPDQPIPPLLKRMRLLPILTPAALSAAAILGADGVAALPIRPDLLHAILTIIVGALLAAAVYGVSFLAQRRLYQDAQKLLPGGLA